jgi:hypothetical protein
MAQGDNKPKPAPKPAADNTKKQVTPPRPVGGRKGPGTNRGSGKMGKK